MAASYSFSDGGIAPFPSVTQVQSSVFYFNNDTTANGGKTRGVVVTLSETLGSGLIHFWIGYCTTVGGTYTWEELKRSTGELNGSKEHVFGATGTYFLKWRSRGYNGAVLNRVKIKVKRVGD